MSEGITDRDEEPTKTGFGPVTVRGERNKYKIADSGDNFRPGGSGEI